MFDFPASPSTGQTYQPAGGPLYRWNGYAWDVAATGLMVKPPTQVVITASSTYNPSPGCSHIEIEGVGGGGGGGGVGGGATTFSAAAGGGSGGYGKTGLLLASAVVITIGAAGAGGAAGAVGGSGGNTTAVHAGITYTFGGGGGGDGLSAANMGSNYVQAGGDHGTCSASVGTLLRVTGQTGGDGFTTGVTSTGYTIKSGQGGSSPFGAGGYNQRIASSGVAVGYAASGYGAGGGGGLTWTQASNALGGVGTQGAVVITEYYFPQPQTPMLLTALDQNLIVNPAIQHSQEVGFSQSSNSGGYPADQWMVSFSGPTWGTHIAGSAYAAGYAASYTTGAIGVVGQATAYTSVAAGNWAGYMQSIEGQTMAPLQWGTANAIPAVLDFEAYISAAGTYCVALRSGNSDRSIVFPIVVAAGEVNTWKRYTFAVPAPTSGTFAKDNTKGLELWFTVMGGTTMQLASSGSWLNVNGIGLTGMSNLLATANQFAAFRKVGLYPDPGGTGIAPPFQVPDFATELVKCQRYWQMISGIGNIWSGNTTSGNTYYGRAQYPVTMRTTPTVTGVLYNQFGFPATLGSFSANFRAYWEGRTANVTQNASYFYTDVYLSARM